MKLWQGAAMDTTAVFLILVASCVAAALTSHITDHLRDRRTPPTPPNDEAIRALTHAFTTALEHQAGLVDKYMVQCTQVLKLHVDPVVGGTPQAVEIRKIELEADRVALAKREMDVRSEALRMAHGGGRQGPVPPSGG